MNENVKFLQHATIVSLQQNIKDNFSLYQPKSANFSEISNENIKISDSIEILPDLEDKIKMPTKDENHDVFNSMLVYNSIRLNPRQACYGGIWIYLSHVDLKDYVCARWAIGENISADKKESLIKSHYFVTGQRGLIRDNAIARLWWMGCIASRSRQFKSNPEKALELLLYQSDVRANVLERNLGMNPDIFDAIVSRLERDYSEAQKGSKKTIFERSKFRHLMKSLNRIGGYRMLDALAFKQLQFEIEQILCNST